MKKLTLTQRKRRGQQQKKKHDKYVRNRSKRLLEFKKIKKLEPYRNHKKQLEEIQELVKKQSDNKKQEGGLVNK